MKSITFELQKLRFDAPLNATGDLLMLTTLLLPRPGIQRKADLKTFRLQKGRTALGRKPFYEKALLKEKVEGRFGLTLQLTRPLADSEFQGWLRALAGLGIETAGDLLASGLSPTALRPLLREPFDAVAETVREETPDFILAGGLDLESEDLESGSLT